MSAKARVAVIAVIAVGLGWGGVAWMRADDARPEKPTIVVKTGTLDETASLTGTVDADVRVSVKSQASGEIIELPVQVGDTVKAGALLARLDPVDEERSVNMAAAALASAKAQLAQAKAQLQIAVINEREADASAEVRRKGRARGLISSETARTAENNAAAARATVALRRADIQMARAQVESAQLSMDDAKRRLAQTTIRAPIDGTVLSLAVQKGTIVSSGITNIGGGTELLSLGDLSTLYVVGQLDESDVGRVHVGQPVTIDVDAYPNRTFKGEVERISPLGVETASIVTFDVNVRVTDDDARLLRPGMTADLSIVTAEYKDIPLVPVSAIRSEGRQRYVLLASGERRDVEVAGTDGHSMAIEKGLSAGARVITSDIASAPKDRGFRLFGSKKKSDK